MSPQNPQTDSIRAKMDISQTKKMLFGYAEKYELLRTSVLFAAIIAPFRRMLKTSHPVRKKIYVAKYACIGLAAAVPSFLLNLLPIPFPLLSLILCFVVFVGIYVGLLHLVKDSMLTESIGGLKRKIAAKRGKLPPSDKGDDDE